MPRLQAFSALYDAITSKMQANKLKHKRFINTLELEEENFSVMHSTIKLPKVTKHVKIYYSKDATALYRKILAKYREARDEAKVKPDNLVKLLDKLVSGWNNGKEVTPKDLHDVDVFINNKAKAMKDIEDGITELIAQFKVYNDDDTEFVDWVIIPLFRPTDVFEYNKAYTSFFSSAKVNDDLVIAVLNSDSLLLDRLINMATVLYAGYEKLGKGEEYEDYRRVQRELLLLVERTGELVEYHMRIFENFSNVRDMRINMKIWPYEKDGYK